ncbi:MAG: transposase, partial [Desulfobulbaceae bacterium]
NYPLGWELMPTENTAAIHTALRRAIIALGKLPLVAYLDNGRAFKAKHFTVTNDFDNGAIAGLYARLGIATTFATPYHGQSKTVERFFGTMLEMESILPTYCGNSIGNKPARMHRGERLHRQLWEKYGGAEIAITWSQAHEILAAWFDDYATRPQRGHLDGKSPLEVFEAGRGPGVNLDDLHELMMSVEIKSATKEGVKMFGEFYYHPAIYGRREPVVAYFDTIDRSCLYLYEKTGEFICRAEPQAGVHPAALLLGSDDELEILKQELATKQRMKSLTVGPARQLLRTVVLPEHQRQLEQIGLLPDGEGKRQLPAPAKVVHIDAEKLAREVAEHARYQAEADERDFRADLMALESFDRYDRLLELTAKGVELAEEWTGFMAFYEKSDEYLESKEFWDQRIMAYAIMHRAERTSQ